MSEQEQNKIESADEAKKVPDKESEWTEADSNVNEVAQAERVNLLYPVKSHQNGTVQPLEPSAAVAAVTVSSGNNPSSVVPGDNPFPEKTTNTPLPSSTSPAGGVPFPLTLLHQEEYSAAVVKSSSEENSFKQQHHPPSQQTNQKCSGTYTPYGNGSEPLRLQPTSDTYPSANHLSKQQQHCPVYSTSHAYQNLPENSNQIKTNNLITSEERLHLEQNSSYREGVPVSHGYFHKYSQEGVIKHRNTYPKDRTYDYLKRAEAQRKSSHSKSDTIQKSHYHKTDAESRHYHHHHSHHHHPQTQQQNHLGTGNVAYQQSKHSKHSEHKPYLGVAHSLEKISEQKKQQNFSAPDKSSKDNYKKSDNCDLYNSKYIGSSVERVPTSTADIYAGYAKQNYKYSLNSHHEKWTESSYFAQQPYSVKKDSQQNVVYSTLGAEKRTKDSNNTSKEGGYTYRKWSDDLKYSQSINSVPNKQDVQRHIKHNSNELVSRDKQLPNWYNSTYPYNNPYPTEDRTPQKEKHHRQIDYSSQQQEKDFSWQEKENKKCSNGSTVAVIPVPESSSDHGYYPSISEPESFQNYSGNKPYLVCPTTVASSSLIDTSTTNYSVLGSTDYSLNLPAESTTIYSTTRDSLKLSWSSTKTTALSVPGPISLECGEIPTARGRHSSHGSSGSASSLSQLSQSFGGNSNEQGGTTWFPPKDTASAEGNSSSSTSSNNNRSQSNSRNPTPSAGNSATTPTSILPPTTSSTSFETSGTLTSLVFSKPSTWTTTTLSTAGTQQLSSSSGSAIRPSTSPLSSGLQSQAIGGGSLFSTSPSLLSGSGHQVMYAPPLAPAGSFLPPTPAAAAGAQVFPTDSLFVSPNQDLLRRELDTRFLASHDRSINIPPPPYMRTEMHQHQHQHTHMHQHSPFLPPPLGGPLMPQGAAHLYDKFPKLDSSFYGRGSIGLPGYAALSPFLAPSAAAAAAVTNPFGPPGHLAAFQPKGNPSIKTKQVKSGRWCTMHVKIAWEIYHHQQQKQHQQGDKASTSSATLPTPTKSSSELLHPSTALFSSIPKPHDLNFSSSIFGAASRLSSIPPRSIYDVTSPHSGFISPAHLGLSPLARPAYPAFGTPASSFGGLGALPGFPGAGLFGGKDIGSGLTLHQDPWTRLHRTPPSAFPSPSTSNSSGGSSSWGGLKAEAERERERLQQRDEQEKEKQKKLTADKEKKENERTKELSRDKRDQEKQKEKDRENRQMHHSINNIDVLHNGDFVERNRPWERTRENREHSRSPVRIASGPKMDGSAFDSSGKPKSDNVRVKEEKKEGEHSQDPERTKSTDSSSSNNDRTRSKGPIMTEHSPLPPQFWSPLPPSPVFPMSGATSLAMSEHYRNLELQQLREMDRDQLMQKYGPLHPSLPIVSDRLREAELARHSAYEAEHLERDRQMYERKLIPPPLRTDMAFVPPLGVPPPPVPTTATQSNGSGLFPFSNSFLSSYCSSSSPQNNKNSVPPGIAGNGIPPPLIPCGSPSNVTPGQTIPHTPQSPQLHLKPPVVTPLPSESPQDSYGSKDKRELSNPARDAESQSR